MGFRRSLGGADRLGIELMLTRILAAPAVLAAASLAATPAVAAELPVFNPAPVEATSHYGPYVSAGWGWGGGRGHRGRHHRRGSTAGDILTGVLILGTIAAVANAARRNAERRSYPERYPNPDRRYDRPNDWRPDGPQGLEGAADLCLREIERNARAREVSRVERTADGWLVTGSMADGAAFSCSIGADGRIERLDVGGRAQEIGSADDRQYDDETYRSARADEAVGAEAGPQPDYPGGPLPGDEEGGAVEAEPES